MLAEKMQRNFKWSCLIPLLIIQLISVFQGCWIVVENQLERPNKLAKDQVIKQRNKFLAFSHFFFLFS